MRLWLILALTDGVLDLDTTAAGDAILDDPGDLLRGVIDLELLSWDVSVAFGRMPEAIKFTRHALIDYLPNSSHFRSGGRRSPRRRRRG